MDPKKPNLAIPPKRGKNRFLGDYFVTQETKYHQSWAEIIDFGPFFDTQGLQETL